MINSIFIDIDTERERAVIFGKPPETPRPANAEEAKKMILDDVVTLAEALTVLILTADQNGYADKNDLIRGCEETLRHAANNEEPQPEIDDTTEN